MRKNRVVTTTENHRLLGVVVREMNPSHVVQRPVAGPSLYEDRVGRQVMLPIRNEGAVAVENGRVAEHPLTIPDHPRIIIITTAAVIREGIGAGVDRPLVFPLVVNWVVKTMYIIHHRHIIIQSRMMIIHDHRLLREDGQYPS